MRAQRAAGRVAAQCIRGCESSLFPDGGHSDLDARRSPPPFASCRRGGCPQTRVGTATGPRRGAFTACKPVQAKACSDVAEDSTGVGAAVKASCRVFLECFAWVMIQQSANGGNNPLLDNNHGR